MRLSSFSVSDQDGVLYTEKNFSKGKFILYVYPKDMTPGCTLESQNFRDLHAEFAQLKVSLFGVSKDSQESHCRFIKKESLSFPLLSDPELELIQLLGAWKEKTMYGKTFLGVSRTTVFIQDGVIVHTWNNVRAKGHAEKVLEFVREHLSR